MGNELLDQWELLSLEHHCGVCQRPLSHPNAIRSCFGIHCEPCHRFHHVMLLCNRAGTCAPCIKTDEAHYKRHVDIAEKLRVLYEINGEAWDLISEDERSRKRGRGRDNDSSAPGADSDLNLIPNDSTLTKRERKDAKKLMRAASRPRVITSDEIRYIDEIIHPTSTAGNAIESLLNPDEIDEIERQLCYNANVYKTEAKRCEIKNLGHLPPADVDFDVEMERILDTLRFTDLQQRNTKNRGLQGKELKAFKSLVIEFNKTVVEDLKLAKSDERGTRSRRAGYLRYINRTSFDSMKERHTDKNWKTGERIIAESSKAVLPPEGGNQLESHIEKDSVPCPTTNAPDCQHLEQYHKRVDSNHLEQHLVPHKHPPQSRLPQENGAPMPPAPSVNAEKPVMHLSETAKKNDTIRSAVDNKDPGPLSTDPSTIEEGIAEMTLKAGASEGSSPRTISMSNEQDTAAQSGTGCRPISKKKKKVKKSKHRANNVGEKEADAMNSSDSKDKLEEGHDGVSHSADHETRIRMKIRQDNTIMDGKKNTLQVSEIMALVSVPPQQSPTRESIPCPPPSPHSTDYDGHTDWKNYDRNLIPDQLTDPFLFTQFACESSILCEFEGNDVPDCPFHTPRCTHCCLFGNDYYVTYPSHSPFYLGPYHFLRALKLLSVSNENEKTKDRLVVLERDLKDMLDNNFRPEEFIRHFSKLFTSSKGTSAPVTMQATDFLEKMEKNNCMTHQLTQREVEPILQKGSQCGDQPLICYCQSAFPPLNDHRNIVQCSYRNCSIQDFHYGCARMLGANKLSKWYCNECDVHMGNEVRSLFEWLEARETAMDTLPDGNTQIELKQCLPPVNEAYGKGARRLWLV